MTVYRRLRRWTRKRVAFFRVYRILNRTQQLRQDVLVGVRFLGVLGFLESCEFHQQEILFRWAVHPRNVLSENLADATFFRYTDRLERRWRWSVRMLVRVARLWNMRFAAYVCTEHKIPLDQ